MSRRDGQHNGRHGGVILIANRDSVKAISRSGLPAVTSELYFVDIVLPNRNKLTLRVLYRPPNDDTKPLEDLKLALNQIFLCELILVGDFNPAPFHRLEQC